MNQISTLFLFLILPFFLTNTNSFVINTITQNCNQLLPYGTINIKLSQYQSWYGKVGQNINGTYYQHGHALQEHVAVSGKCTSEQKTDSKTVFRDLQEFYKILSMDVTSCTMSSQKAFNFLQHHSITNPSSYIHGIDCKTGKEQVFSRYFIEYKRAVKNPKPSQSEYMASQKATVWTLYPER